MSESNIDNRAHSAPLTSDLLDTPESRVRSYSDSYIAPLTPGELRELREFESTIYNLAPSMAGSFSFSKVNSARLSILDFQGKTGPLTPERVKRLQSLRERRDHFSIRTSEETETILDPDSDSDTNSTSSFFDENEEMPWKHFPPDEEVPLWSALPSSRFNFSTTRLPDFLSGALAYVHSPNYESVKASVANHAPSIEVASKLSFAKELSSRTLQVAKTWTRRIVLGV